MAVPDVRFLIVVPTKNRRNLLERALESALSQSYDMFRVVVINDGSSDNTRTYLDSIRDRRIRVIHQDKSRGVNAARNAALRTLEEGEWAVPLDDDDILLPHALELIAQAVKNAPPSVEVLHFNTIIRMRSGEFTGGYRFEDGETWHEQTYFEVMTKSRLRADGRSALKFSLFPRYLYAEDINGLESEFLLRLARDGIKSRYIRETIMLLDQSHTREHLSDTAARRNPASFVRANMRIFHDHAQFFSENPRIAMTRAMGAFKVSIRACDPMHAALFTFYYLRSLVRSIFRRSQ